MKRITFGEIKMELQNIGCENVAFTNEGLQFNIGSLKNIELRYLSQPNGLCIFENGNCKIAFGYDYEGVIDHLKRVIINEKKGATK